MLSLTGTNGVARLTSRRGTRAARATSILRILLGFLMLAALCCPLMAQETGGGEANLKLPDLNSATFLGGVFSGGINGGTLLMGGLVVSALGLVFGLIIFVRLRNMPVHSSML
jgi:K(+)-stimulated pyrophosphate-energized sodium pump